MKEKITEIMYMVEKMPPSKLETDIIVKLMELKDIFSIDNTNVIAHNGKEVNEELKTILKLSTDVMFLKDDINNLNKGIDELIKKYEDKISRRIERMNYFKEINDREMYALNKQAKHDYEQIIQELKEKMGGK